MVGTVRLLLLQGAPERAWLCHADPSLRAAPGAAALVVERMDSLPLERLLEDPESCARLLGERWDLVLLPLSPQLENREAPLEETARGLLRVVAQLQDRDAQVVLANLFRHVPRARADRAALLSRIRELNALARRVSHETGCFLLDLDRELAHEGGLRLEADCFGGGARAAELAVAELTRLAFEVLADRLPEAAA